MRFIHTADWHLGRLFHGTHLTEDQAYVLLGQFVQLVRDAKAEAVVIAGDVYDRAVPPPDAVELLDDVLSHLVLDAQVPVILIAGNHDSPGRLNFGARLLAGRRLYVTGTLRPQFEPLVLHDAHGPLNVHSLPFVEPALVRQALGCDSITDQQTAMSAILDRVRQAKPTGMRSIVIAHAFVAGGEECPESERPLSVGGAGTVDAACFRGIDYVALGHLHRPQSIRCGNGNDDHTEIHYSGSLLKYSFEEADHIKGACVVDMDAAGRCVCEPVELRPRREVRRVAGTMRQLLTAEVDASAREDYLEVTLLDDGPVFDAIGRLRERYPNVMSIRRPEKETGEGAGVPRIDVRALEDGQLFGSFFRDVTGEELSAAQTSAYAAVVEEMRQQEREAGTAEHPTPSPPATPGEGAVSEGSVA